MVAKNDITGDSIQTRNTSKEYENNYDLIFGNKSPSVKIKEKSNEELKQIIEDLKEEIKELKWRLHEQD
jgi:uncharacterized FlaG/YvyC family protein